MERIKTYEVKAWITVKATDEEDALIKAAALLDLLPTDTISKAHLEGEGAVYEVELDAA